MGGYCRFLRIRVGRVEMKIGTINGKIIVEGLTEKQLIIPSQMYPLSGPMEYFCSENTEDCDDQQLREIYDSIEPQIGFCYSNIERLADAMAEAGIHRSRYRTYCGWLFIGWSLPIHHAFMVVDNKYMLDFSINKAFEIEEQFKDCENAEKTRNKMIDLYIQQLGQPNSTRTAFGKVGPHYFYVGSKCKPSEGKRLYQRLMKSHPNHPCGKNVTATGATEMQNRIYKRVMETNMGQFGKMYK